MSDFATPWIAAQHASLPIASLIPFSSCLQSFPESGSFPKGQFLTSGGQSIGASASALALPMNIQDLFPLVLSCNVENISYEIIYKEQSVSKS